MINPIYTIYSVQNKISLAYSLSSTPFSTTTDFSYTNILEKNNPGTPERNVLLITDRLCVLFRSTPYVLQFLLCG